MERFPIKGAKVRKCFVPYIILKGPWRGTYHTNDSKKWFIILYYTYTRGDLLWCSSEAAVKWGGELDTFCIKPGSRWDKSFLKSTVVAFSMQFLHAGNWAKVIKGDLSSEVGKVTSTDHTDIERMFWIGDMVRVVAGQYFGVEGHIIEMVDDIFCLCQDVSKEEVKVEVSKYYLDQRSLTHTWQARPPTQQLFTPPTDVELIQIGDCVEVLVGEHIDKCGIVHWLPKGGDCLWFQDGTLYIPVPIAVVRRTHLPYLQTLQFTKDKGYDVKPGDIDIGQKVFIIGGDRKGYRATLYSLSVEKCTIALHGQQRTTIPLQNVATRYGRRLNSAMLKGIDMLSFYPGTSSSAWTNWTTSPEDQACSPLPSINPSSLTADPKSWTVDTLDNIDSQSEKLKEGPLAWLMTKEFCSKFTMYHMMLKVSPSFMRGRLHNQFVSTACPDPFLCLNGPAPEGCVAVFCSLNGAGAAIQHYHIPITDLSPAPPRKKNQERIVLDGSHRSSISTIAKCNLKKNTVDIAVTPSTLVNLRFDQICLLEKSCATM
ncbi:hypothetical protein EV702DRAFT_1044479 [Suillus placidus]|uniref:KOW domain-containing protein n=1 Tax=Suillus placidus TaxID=48579 RepID=A0A9P6ZY92_9AGAM|nr:hypothetical protein EV702DRAFT_1044479 [Suillus placidus]